MQKNVKMTTPHTAYNLWYHIVFCPKYRKSVIQGPVEVEVKKLFADICVDEGWEIGALEVMPDHIHLFVSAPPTISPMEIVKRLKSITAISLFYRFPDLKKRSFWGAGMWSKGYYVGTAGTVTAETVKKYIEEQKTASSSRTSREVSGGGKL